MAKKKKGGKPRTTQTKSNDSQVERSFVKAQKFHQAGRLYEAEQAYLAVLAVSSTHHPSLLNLAQIALDVARYPLALSYARKAVELNHADAKGHLILGIVLRELGLTDLAESELVIAQQLNPDDSLIPNNLGLLYMQQGRTQEANDALYKAISIDPERAFAYYHLASNKKITPDDPDVSLIESLRDFEDGLEGGEKVVCHFALGKVYHDCGRFDEAFREYRQANAYQREMIEYDALEQQELTGNIISTCDKGLAARLADVGCDSKAPVFIVGMPRSGTTLVESLLCRHPEISSIGETPYIGNLVNAICQRTDGSTAYPGSLALLTPALCKQMGEEYVALSRQFGVQSERIIDKMPDNFLRLGFILSVLPNAKIIHCVRDPMDVCLSIYQQYFSQGMRFSYDLEEIGTYFLQYKRVMAHWHSLFPNKIYDVAYQDVVNDPEGNLRNLVDFCGLSFDENDLLQQGEGRTIRTASVWQARQPVYKTSVQRWRHYEKQLGPLLETLSPILGESE